ncbi:MAG TPA: YdcF family protein [Firmicutes bacterium]|jgi:uncharacterized SAM-binding protein YcdF (DUF218 family)|nr:YdcF family protein [Bacillota bacterium]
MLYLIKFIYITFILPPGIFILLFLLLSGWLLVRKQRIIAGVLLGITILLYAGSSFVFSDLLIHALEYRYRPAKKIQGDVIVVLGGGATLDSPNLHSKGHLSGAAANRLLTAIQLNRELKIPILFSGGKVYQNTGREAEIAKSILKDVGIADDQIMVENRSLNTTENAVYTKIILDRFHFRQPILVTSAFHMPRAQKQFEKAGVLVLPYPTDYHTNTYLKFAVNNLFPSADALENFSLALKEYIGLLAIKWY